MIVFIKYEKEDLREKVLREYLKFSKLFEELDNDYYLLEHKP